MQKIGLTASYSRLVQQREVHQHPGPNLFHQVGQEVAVICGLDKHLTMHLARHTFATYLLTKNVPIESVSKLLGHKSLKTTQIYAKVIDSKVADDISAIISKTPILSLQKVS